MRFSITNNFPRSSAAAWLLGLSLSYSLQLAKAAICADKFMEAYPVAAAESLLCEPFPGDPKLHAIVYGCMSVNQDMELPDGVISQSFNRKCLADVGDDTTFTCYELSLDTDYSTFTAAVDPTLECTSSEEEFEFPLFQYQESSASYEFSGAQGEQGSSGLATETFQPQMAQGVYYTTVVQAGEPPLQFTDDPKDAAGVNETVVDPPETVETDAIDGSSSTEPPTESNAGEEGTPSSRGIEIGSMIALIWGLSSGMMMLLW